MTPSDAQSKTPDRKVETPTATKTKEAWFGRAEHSGVTLPSGAVVSINLPNLSQLLKAGDIPNPLADAAIEFENAKEQKVTKERVVESFDFVCWILPRTVVTPAINQEDVEQGKVPSEDVDMLCGFIARTLDMDAIGHHLGGLETNRGFRRFRNIIDWDEVSTDTP